MYKIWIVKERKVLTLCQKKIIKTIRIIRTKKITKIIKTEITIMKTVIITVDNFKKLSHKKYVIVSIFYSKHLNYAE